MTDIKMLPLPSPQVPFIDCDPSMTDIRRLVRWYEQGATEHARAVAEHNVRLRGGIDPLAVLIRAQEAEARAEALKAEREVIAAEAVKYADKSGRLEAKVERLQAELDNRWAQGVHTCHDKCQRIACVLRRDNKRLAEALQLALDSHGVTLMTDPPQDAWKSRGVEEKARAALREYEQEKERE